LNGGVLFLIALLGLTVANAKKRYDGYKVIQMTPVTDEQIALIHDMHDIVELDFWSDTDVMVPSVLLQSIFDKLNNVNTQFKVIVNDVQIDLDAEEMHLATRSRDSKAYDLYNWNTYAQIVEVVEDLQSNCPSGYTCTKESVGTSYLGNDVPALVITSGNKPMVYLDSLIHCREWLAGATTLLLADRLINGNDAEAQRMRSTYNWYIAPVINPDGYLYTWSNERLWRKNRAPNSGTSCIGTDLNRNFDVKWRYAGTSTLPCSDTYGGPSAGSAIETQNVQNKLNSLNNLHGIVSYHAYANMWLHAYGYTTVAGGSTCALSSSFNAVNRVALAARNAIQSTGGQSWTYGPVCSVIYPASGSTVDYAHDVSGCIYAYTPEVRGTSFAPPTSQISPNYLEQWAGLVAMVDAISLQ
jgi:hypothetical protein